MGRLLGDIASKMHQKTKENLPSNSISEETPKILMHSTHDTALAALTSTLDVFDDRCAAFDALRRMNWSF